MLQNYDLLVKYNIKRNVFHKEKQNISHSLAKRTFL